MAESAGFIAPLGRFLHREDDFRLRRGIGYLIILCRIGGKPSKEVFMIAAAVDEDLIAEDAEKN
jgi:hypothetical protein